MTHDKHAAYGRMGGLVKASRYLGRESTAAATGGRWAHLYAVVDPSGALETVERERRFVALRREQCQKMRLGLPLLPTGAKERRVEKREADKRIRRIASPPRACAWCVAEAGGQFPKDASGSICTRHAREWREQAHAFHRKSA